MRDDDASLAGPYAEPWRPAKQDGQSMAYQLTLLGISVEALLQTHRMHGYETVQTQQTDEVQI